MLNINVEKLDLHMTLTLCVYLPLVDQCLESHNLFSATMKPFCNIDGINTLFKILLMAVITLDNKMNTFLLIQRE